MTIYKEEDAHRWSNLKERWYDVEYQVEKYISTLDKLLLGETFPVFWSNLGPNVYAGMATTKWTTNDIPNLNDKVFIITEANAGLGYEATKD